MVNPFQNGLRISVRNPSDYSELWQNYIPIRRAVNTGKVLQKCKVERKNQVVNNKVSKGQ